MLNSDLARATRENTTPGAAARPAESGSDAATGPDASGGETGGAGDTGEPRSPAATPNTPGAEPVATAAGTPTPPLGQPAVHPTPTTGTPAAAAPPTPAPARSAGTGNEVYTGPDTVPMPPVRPLPTDGEAGPFRRRRVRARLARRIASGGPRPAGSLRPVLEPLVATHRAAHPKADVREIARAYDVAEERHRGQLRKSGDPYITHPLAVATILAELGMDTTTLAAALLHDTVEDTGLTKEEIEEEFGAEVAHLVDGVTKLDKVKYGAAAEAETIRKMIIAMARDPRVLVIKLADRLHNMRTLRFLPPHKQEQKAREVLEVLAPLAHRLGMNTIKWELEDLGFATLYPKMYDEIVKLVAERAPERDVYLDQCVNVVSAELRAERVKATVSGRPKHYYSIYQKMIVRGRDFTDIYDLVGIRVLVESHNDCYAALGIIHATWQPIPGRFKDYIAMPKFNMYQSLHTTVIGPGGKPVELQIRSHAMHRTAEYGIAAHWKYKEQKDAPVAGPVAQDEMAWLRQLLDWQRETQEPEEFLDSLRFDLGAREVYVFTPKGDVIPLPAGSTPVDFAYAIHTDVGHRCIGARVNKKLVALESKLENGDTVDIFTSRSEQASPSRDWLAFAKSPRAKNKIRQWFAKERREDAIEAGKEAISRALRKQGLPLQRLLGGDALPTLAKDMRYHDVSALYAAVGENQVSALSVVQRLITGLGGPEGAVEDIAETAIPTRVQRRPATDPGVVVAGGEEVWVKLAKCCTPVPGDEIIGFVTRGGGVSVHRRACTNAAALLRQEERLVEVSWKPSTDSVFLVAIQVEALDRHRLLSDITRVLSDERVNILSATVSTTRDRVAISRFTFELGDPMHLGHVLRTIRNVDGVYDVYRVASAS